MRKLLSPKVWLPILIVLVVLVALAMVIPPVALPEIVIAPEPVFTVLGWPITNTLLASWLTMIILIVVSWLATRKMSLVPGRFQGLMEMIVEGFYDLCKGVAGENTRKFFPIVMTIFLFLVVSNWLGITPIYGSIGVLHHSEHGNTVEWINESHTVGVWEKVATEAVAEPDEAAHGEAEHGESYALAPLFRSAATDLNLTFGLAITSMVLVQYFGLRSLGLSYLKKFFNFSLRPLGLIDAFVGILELMSEFSKIISFSFRLFGNIFAGEVLLGVMAFLIPFVVSLPFYGLELLVGLVQALIFMMLTLSFFVIAQIGHDEEAH